jgi:hypothetical protein
MWMLYIQYSTLCCVCVCLHTTMYVTAVMSLTVLTHFWSHTLPKNNSTVWL